MWNVIQTCFGFTIIHARVTILQEVLLVKCAMLQQVHGLSKYRLEGTSPVSCLCHSNMHFSASDQQIKFSIYLVQQSILLPVSSQEHLGRRVLERFIFAW